MALTTEKAIQQLTLFNETCETLERFSFLAKLRRNSRGFTITWMYKEEDTIVTTEVKGPDEESICAFILKYRLFIQDKDGISLRQMNEIYKNLPLPNKYYQRFQSAQHNFNYILDSPTVYYTDGVNLKMREVHDMFIYGSLIHIDARDAKRKKFLDMIRNPVKTAILTSSFQSMLGKLIKEIMNIKTINEEVIGLLKLESAD